MRCNLKTKNLPHKCPKCGAKLNSERCVCGHILVQEKDKFEKEWERRLSYGDVPYFY